MRLWRWLRRRYRCRVHVPVDENAPETKCCECGRWMWRRIDARRATYWLTLDQAVAEFEEGYRDDPGRSPGGIRR